jgi:hypothetical protein
METKSKWRNKDSLYVQMSMIFVIVTDDLAERHRLTVHNLPMQNNWFLLRQKWILYEKILPFIFINLMCNGLILSSGFCHVKSLIFVFNSVVSCQRMHSTIPTIHSYIREDNIDEWLISMARDWSNQNVRLKLYEDSILPVEQWHIFLIALSSMTN